MSESKHPQSGNGLNCPKCSGPKPNKINENPQYECGYCGFRFEIKQ